MAAPPVIREPKPGEVRAGCRIERLLGRGGMGSAWLGVRAHDGLPVVLKLLAPALAHDVSLRARFQREWEALRRVRHPHVVLVHEVDGAGEPPCIVLEFVEGASLDKVVEERGRLPVAEALALACGVARGLAALHAVGLVHRDVKPANLIRTPQGGVKVVDLGLAKDLFKTAMTRPGQLLGTANYMAPEQWEERPIDPRSDVFALGATLYHLLLGRPPFAEAGDDLDGIADKALSGDFPRPTALAPEVPRELELALLRMLAPDPGLRYARAEDVVEDLESVARGGPARVPALVVEAGGAGAPLDRAAGSGGARVPLLPGEFFCLGADPGGAVVLAGPGVAPRHAQVRRESRGFVLRDLQSPAGTFVGEERVAPGQARPLRDGDRLRLGSATLRFVDPAGAGSDASFLRDVERAAAPLPVVEALAGLSDARAAAFVLERLAPGPDDGVLTALLGPDVARAARERCLARAPHEAAAATQLLARLTGLPAPHDPLAWLAWWHSARTAAPAQLGPAPPPVAELLQVLDDAQAGELPLAGRGLVLVGRDARCHVRLERPDARRLAVTLLRLHRRWVAVEPSDAGPGRAAFLDPGADLSVGPSGGAPAPAGPLRLRLLRRAPPARAPDGTFPVDAREFAALEELRHPATARALVGLLRPWRPELEAGARALFAERPAQDDVAQRVAARCEERGRAARAALAALLGRDLGPEAAAWEGPLGERFGAVPQLTPRGWFA